MVTSGQTEATELSPCDPELYMLLLQNSRVIHGGPKSEAETRAYASRGLLRCVRCGRRTHAHHVNGHNYE